MVSFTVVAVVFVTVVSFVSTVCFGAVVTSIVAGLLLVTTAIFLADSESVFG